MPTSKTASCFQLGVRFPDGSLQTTAATGGSLKVNGISVAAPNLIDSASVTFSVVGSNISLAASGTVTSFSASTLSPLFTTSVATATTTPALTFSLSNAAGGTVFGNNITGAAGPAFTIAPVLGIPGTSTGSIALASSTASGKFTITAPASTSTPTLTLPITSNVLAGQFAGDGVIFNSILNTASAAGTLTPTLLTQTAYYVLAGPGTAGPAATPTFRALVAGDIPAPVSGTILWSALGNAGAALTLANAGYATTFNQTSAVNWTWANTTVATSITTNASPLLEVAANYWTGAASAADTWTIGSSLVAGTNGASTLTIAHTGSTGNACVLIPTGVVGSGGVCGLGLGINTVGLAASGNTLYLKAGTTGQFGTINFQLADLGANNLSITRNNTGPTIQFYGSDTSAACLAIAGEVTTGAFPSITLCNNIVGSGSFTGTSGAQGIVFIGGNTLGQSNGGTFAPTSGNATFYGLQIAPVINQTGSASGSYTALKIAATETALLGTANKLIQCFAGSAGTTEEFTVDNVGKVTQYGGVTTVKQGVAPILAAPARLTSQTAAQSAVSLVASALAGMYRISYVASITTASDISSVLGGALGFAVTFTDPQDSVAKTSNPTTPTVSAANTTGTTVSGVVNAYCKAGTALTYNFGYTDSHTSTAMAYNIAVYAEYLG